MPRPSVVAVYGTRTGERRPERLGSGRLELDRLVLPHKSLNTLLASADPPRVLRVGIASISEHEPLVEVIEVSQTVRSDDGEWWAIELSTPAESPTAMEAMADPDGTPPVPANGWCWRFSTLSFCP